MYVYAYLSMCNTCGSIQRPEEVLDPPELELEVVIRMLNNPGSLLLTTDSL